MNIDPIQELKDINTDGTTIRTNKETGKMIIRLKQGISEKVMNEICFYLYMDYINIDEGSDKQFITEIRDVCFFVFFFLNEGINIKILFFYMKKGCQLLSNRTIGKNVSKIAGRRC